MAVEVNNLETDDMEARVLKALAEGKPYVFLTADASGPGIVVAVACGNGVGSTDDLRTMLELADSQLP
jgi:hypothetical protein